MSRRADTQPSIIRELAPPLSAGLVAESNGMNLLETFPIPKVKLPFAKPFSGLWATYENIDEAAAAITALRKQGRDLSVLSPCPRYELTQALGDPRSVIPFLTLFFGAFGIFVGYAFPSWTALDWVLPVSSKPTVSLPAFTIIGFEMMVLCGGVGTAISIFALGIMDLIRKPLPGSDRFRAYGRFSVDRFGVVVRCPKEQADAVEKTMKSHRAEEIVREN